MRSHELVFVGLGTLGDAWPMLAMARHLRQRGVNASLLANERFRPIAERLEVPFSAIATNREDAQASSGPASTIYPRERSIHRALRARMSAGVHLIIVNTHRLDASNLFAERHGAPVIRVLLSPYRVRSFVAPPVPLDRHPDLRERHAAWAIDPTIVSRVNEARRVFELPPASTADPPEPWVRARLAAFPSWFAPAAADWPPLLCVGFPFERLQPALPGALAPWLSENPYPVVFTPGTAPTMRVEHFFEQAELCCERLGCPGLLLHPDAPKPHSSRVLSLPFVDLGVLLEHASALVHHGGIGTTAQALRAGIPQVISPLVLDQFDNAARVERLQVGRALPRQELSADSLAAVLESLGDDCREACRAIASRLQHEQGLEWACDAIVQTVATGLAEDNR